MKITPSLFAFILAVSSFLPSAATYAEELLTVRLTSGEIVKSGTVIPVTPDFTHPDGENGLMFVLKFTPRRDLVGQLSLSFGAKPPVIPRKSVPGKPGDKWAYHTEGTLTGRVGVKKGVEFDHTLTLWLRKDVKAPYGTSQPVALAIMDEEGVLFNEEVVFQIPAAREKAADVKQK